MRSELLKEQEALVLSIEKLRSEEKELSEEIGELGENKNSLQYQLTQTVDANNKLSTKVQELESKLQDYQPGTSSSPSQVGALEVLQDRNREIEELKTKLESYRKNASTEDVAEENKILKLRIYELEGNLEESKLFQVPNYNIANENDLGPVDISSDIRINQLSEKNSELEASLKALQNERDRIENQLDEKVSELNNANAEKDAKIEEYETKLLDLNDRLQLLANAIGKLNLGYDAKDADEKQKYQAELSVLKSELEKYQAYVEKLAYERIEQNKTKVQPPKFEYENQLKANDDIPKYDYVNSIKTKDTKEFDGLKGEIARKNTEVERLKEELEKQLQEAKNFTEDKNAHNQKVSELESSIKKVTKEKEKLENELDTLTNNNANLQEQINDYQEEGEVNLIKENVFKKTFLNLENEDAEEIEDLKSQLGKLHRENQAQKEMLGTLKQENEKLKVNADNREYIHQKIDGARAPEPKKYEYSVQNQPSIKKLETSAETIETEVPVQYDYETSSIPGKKQEFEYVVSSQKNIKQEKESFEYIQDSKAVPKKNSSIVMESFQTIGDKESSDQGTKTERELKYAVGPIMDINSHQKTTTSIETNTDFGTSSMITNTFNGGEKRSIGINTKIEEVNNAIANKTLFRKVLEEKLLNDFKIKSLDKLVATEKSQYTFREYQLSHHNPDKIMGTDKVEREEVMKNVHEKVKKSHIEPVQEVDQHLYKLGENVTLKLEMDGDKVKFNIDELVSGKATCCISIPRVDGNGAKLNNYDIIEFKDGKMTDYLFSKEGQSQLSEQQIKQMKGLDEKQRAVLLNKGGPWVEKLQTPPQTHSTHITNQI